MNKKLIFLLAIIAFGLPVGVWFLFMYFSDTHEEIIQIPIIHKEVAIQVPTIFSVASSTILLPVPFMSEAPDGVWTGSWKNACEEASITMVENYYKGVIKIPVSEAKDFMIKLFDVQNRKYGTNANSDAERSNYLITNNASFTGIIVDNPTLEDIKNEIREGRPVIAFHYGFALHNENIPFSPTGSSYHSTVVIGFDDATGDFLVNDPGDKEIQEPHRYKYDLYMSSLRDYNYTNDKADGPARVIFTSK